MGGQAAPVFPARRARPRRSRGGPSIPGPGKRVAVYTRVSTQEQATEGFSIAAQRKRLADFCRSQRWVVAGEFVDDGHTGRDVKRPAYARMMAERDQWDAVLVLKMDRIHRNSRNFMAMMDDLRNWGKDFVSSTESLDTSTAMGRFVMDIIQRIAQLESEQIGERVYIGMLEAAQQGKFLGMSDPFGFRFDPKRGNMVIVRAEAEVVREIHRRYFEERWSMRAIAEDLNARAVPTKRGGNWSKRQVHRVVHNPLYEGTRHWEDVLTPGSHPAIIPPGTRKLRRRRRRRAARRPVA